MTLTKLDVARQRYPEFDWGAYQTAITRQSAVTRLALTGSSNRRLATIQPVQPVKETISMTDQEKALIEQGSELIKTIRTQDDYERDVAVAYGSKYGAMQQKAIATIAWHFKLNPNPGLDLLYVWAQDGKLMIHLSYKAWLAMALRYKKFVHSYRRLSDDEATKRGVNAGDIVVLCEIIDFETIEKLVKLKAMGMDIDLNDDKYKVVGVGVWKKGDAVPKGRDAEWVARKRATKDGMTQLIAASYNLSMPDVPEATYDSDGDGWTVAAPELDDDTLVGTAEEQVIEGDFKPSEVVSEVVIVEPVIVETPQPVDAMPGTKWIEVAAYGEQVYGKQWKALRYSLIRGVNAEAKTIEELTSEQLDQLRDVIKTKEASK